MSLSKEKLEKQKQERLGEIRKSNEDYEMKIIEYNKAVDIIVEFQDEHKVKVHTQYQAFLKGEVKNPYHPSVYNIGYLGQGKYKCKENKKITKSYKVWRDMIKRCYDPYSLNKKMTYIDCYVCEEWHCFQNFAQWWEENVYNCNNERMCLDKDILVKGNKVYSPETCIIVPERINILFIKCNKSRGKYPIGVSEYYNKKTNYKGLVVKCNTLEKKEHLGYFPLNRPFQAFTCYKQFKENYIKQVADEYEELIPKELYEALYKYEVEIND